MSNASPSDLEILRSLKSAHGKLREEIGKVIVGQEKVVHLADEGHEFLPASEFARKTLLHFGLSVLAEVPVRSLDEVRNR